jgi:hypothetical protein
MEYARRNQMQYEPFIAYDHGVSCVSPALIPNDHLDMRREQIHYLALALVAPLHPNQNYIGHLFSISS